MKEVIDTLVIGKIVYCYDAKRKRWVIDHGVYVGNKAIKGVSN